MSRAYANFGDLYRAAFSEANPERKQQLLADVKRALDNWAASAESPASALRKTAVRLEAHEQLSRRSVA
jgi:hypothetical protein